MKLLRNWWVWLILAVLAIAAGFAYQSWSKKNAGPEYKTAKIEKGAITAAVSASGTLSPVVSVQVGSQVSGQLKEIYVDFNSDVKQGQLIARIDPETFEYKVRQAQADLDSARAQVLTQQANINAARAEVARQEVNLGEARRDLERKQQLVEKGFISGADRDKTQATFNALQEQVKTAKAQQAVAEANANNAAALVKQREAALAQTRTDLDRTNIKAPVNGIVIKRSVERGQTVAASLQTPELFVIAENLTDMQVDTAIDESEIGRIREGQKASFTVDAFPGRTFEGAVKQIRKAAQTVSNVVTYTVTVSAANPRKELLPGMTANVRIVTDSRSDVLKVPNSALRFKPAGFEGEGKSEGRGGDGKGSAAATPAANAAPANSGGAARGAGGLSGMRERLEKELQLNDSQKAKLEAIFGGMRDKFMAAREAPEGERQKIMERNRADMRAQIMEMLTPEQKKKYEDIIAETSERRGGGTTRGRLFTLDEKGKPKAVNVMLGLTDGSTTEVISPDVKEGMPVITGSTAPTESNKPRQPTGPRMF